MFPFFFTASGIGRKSDIYLFENTDVFVFVKRLNCSHVSIKLLYVGNEWCSVM